MKILEAQSAVLTNLEVYNFLKNQEKEYRQTHRRGPDYLEILRKEMIKYLESKPSPLSQKPLPFDEKSILKLLERLRDYDLTKGEMIMIFNLRPTSVPNLVTVIEDMEERFTPEQQEDIVSGVIEVLGQFDPAEDETDQDMIE